ncbi:TolC family protein [Comamonas testosteroni]|uniref:TolC family protein n=1 Tax=Comamonas testosteroni TaxID=285 RepID=UPI0020D26134|nr:TolC family protein [Comamonas testosteroni]
MSIKSKLPLVFVQQVAAAVALACAVGGAHAAAAGGQAMDMRAAVQAAVAWHPAVRTAQRQLQGADEGVASARAGYYPQVKGGVGAQVNNRDVYPYTSRRVYDASVSVSQMLYDFGKVDSAVKQAEAGIELAQAQVYLSTDDVAREAAQAWVELRRQQAMVAIAKSQLEGVGALAELAWERQVKGASTRSDFMQAQSRRDGARGQLINYEAQARRWQARLMTLTGMQTAPHPECSKGRYAGCPAPGLHCCAAAAHGDGAPSSGAAGVGPGRVEGR